MPNWDKVYKELEVGIEKLGLQLTPSLLLNDALYVDLQEIRQKFAEKGNGMITGKLKQEFDMIKGNIETLQSKVVPGMLESAWKLGTNTVELTFEIMEYADQKNYKASYNTHARLLLSDCARHEDIILRNGMPASGIEESIEIGTISTQELEQLRKAVVTLMNVDEHIWITYRNMAYYDKATNNYFTEEIRKKGWEWLSEEWISDEIEYCRRIRDLFMNVPAEFAQITGGQ